MKEDWLRWVPMQTLLVLKKEFTATCYGFNYSDAINNFQRNGEMISIVWLTFQKPF